VRDFVQVTATAVKHWDHNPEQSSNLLQ
jgi:hypothetical protein